MRRIVLLFASLSLGFLFITQIAFTIDTNSPRRSRLGDPRNAYDVLHYSLRLKVDPSEKTISGSCTLTGRAKASSMDSLILDAGQALQIERVTVAGDTVALGFIHSDERLAIALPETLRPDEHFAVRVAYQWSDSSAVGFPSAVVTFTQTSSGAPWVATSCQIQGAHQWWPCKASFFHPEDKADSVSIEVIVPDTLLAVSNGRYLGSEKASEGWTTYRWSYTHPMLTYLVAIYVGPYVELTQRIALPSQPLIAHYYVLRGNEERARVEFFPRIPDELRLYEKLYGPFPFADNKFALVQSPYPGMEHSTAVAVGPVFPHTLRPGEPNPLSWYLDYFNYMAVHEVAHEWWGDAVSALDWGEFWLHEGFATYTEALWAEHLFGPEVLHQYMARLSFNIDSTKTVYMPRHRDAREAYHLNIYWKGAWVLHMLRYVMGDSAFFAALKSFNTDPRYRYSNATTADFQRKCEQFYGDDLSWFFLEWVYRPGWPHFEVRWHTHGRDLKITVNDTSFCRTRFSMPLDVLLTTTAGKEKHRLWIRPGQNRFHIGAKAPIQNVDPVGLRWILDGPKKGKMWYFTDLDFIKGTFLDSLLFTEERNLFVGTPRAAWESPPRSFYQGVQWTKLKVDASDDPRMSKVKVKVREYHFLKSKRTPWEDLNRDGSVPLSLRNVGRLQYRLEFGELVGEKLPIPKVVLEYR